MARGHHYPAFIFRFPAFIRLVHAWNDLLLQRNLIMHRTLRASMRTFKGQRVADLGFGEGQHLFRLAKRYPQWHFVGIDTDADHIAFATQYAEQSNLHNLKVEQHDFGKAPLSIPLDLVYLVGVLQIIPNEQQFLRHLHASMSEGAELLLYQPVNNHIYLSFYNTVLKHFPNYDALQGRQRIYTEARLTALLVSEGFSIVQTDKYVGAVGAIGNELYMGPVSVLLYAQTTYLRILAAVLMAITLPLALLLKWTGHLLPVVRANAVLIQARRVAAKTIENNN